MTSSGLRLIGFAVLAFISGVIFFTTSPKKTARTLITHLRIPRPSDPRHLTMEVKLQRIEEDGRRIHAAVQRCRDEKRVAVFGFGWEVVCLKSDTIAWRDGANQ